MPIMYSIALCSYDSKCDVWSIGCILWDMANTANTFVFVSASYMYIPYC